MKNILDIGKNINLTEDDLFCYGKYMAKIKKTILIWITKMGNLYWLHPSIQLLMEKGKQLYQ